MTRKDPTASPDSPDHVEAQMAALAEPPPMPPLLRPKKAQEYIGVGKTKFYELIDAGILEKVKEDGARMSYVTMASCDRYLISLMRNKTIGRKYVQKKKPGPKYRT
jgi:hypothetical protein